MISPIDILDYPDDDSVTGSGEIIEFEDPPF